VDQLVEQFAECVYRFALRLSGDHHVAEDMTQETFLRAWKHRRRLADVQKVRVWLLTVTANQWRDRLRRGRNLPMHAAPMAEETVGDERNSPGWSDERDDVDRALAAMQKLPARQREVLHLVACEQMSLAEAAEVLEMTTDALKASLSLARKKMRQWFVDLYQDKKG
jgi:RNA polymerase sigma-70 factor (ECF subfamily)